MREMIQKNIEKKSLLEEVIHSSSRIHQLISVLNKKEKFNSPIKFKELCFLLNINLNKLKELFKAEKINYVENSSMQISVQKLIKLKTKIEVIIRDKHIKNIYDKSLRELMINSESFLSILEAKKKLLVY